ncbi:hypothetical protein M413DRAFT_265532 [Hebeloma cylindrosporum]|uniref:Uncharacterized protein n=1 Tax=Hebeloma cylindrosporum TaxID=76867 RepID=A0A0C3CSM5_HEBCY|nr:hypothetical protein M413DRAFT_265532 [Hebeloma cylindrosporum h7]
MDRMVLSRVGDGVKFERSLGPYSNAYLVHGVRVARTVQWGEPFCVHRYRLSTTRELRVATTTVLTSRHRALPPVFLSNFSHPRAPDSSKVVTRIRTEGSSVGMGHLDIGSGGRRPDHFTNHLKPENHPIFTWTASIVEPRALQ